MLLARGVVLEMPQLSSSLSPDTSPMDSDGTPSPVPHKSQQAEEILEKSSSRSARSVEVHGLALLFLDSKTCCSGSNVLQMCDIASDIKLLFQV